MCVFHDVATPYELCVYAKNIKDKKIYVLFLLDRFGSQISTFADEREEFVNSLLIEGGRSRFWEDFTRAAGVHPGSIG